MLPRFRLPCPLRKGDGSPNPPAPLAAGKTRPAATALDRSSGDNRPEAAKDGYGTGDSGSASVDGDDMGGGTRHRINASDTVWLANRQMAVGGGGGAGAGAGAGVGTGTMVGTGTGTGLDFDLPSMPAWSHLLRRCRRRRRATLTAKAPRRPG